MKKLDFTKPFVRIDSGEPAYFIREMKGRESDKHRFLFYHTVGGCDQLFWTDDCGYHFDKKVKNVPETITFWVPVWRSEGEGVYLGQLKETQHKPTSHYADLIKWEGPFTITVD